MKNNQRIIASIFLILFSCIQIADLHVVSHDANDIDCNICQFALDQHDDDFDYTCQLEIPDATICISDTSNSFYKSRFVNDYIYFSLQNKAPPVL